MPAIDFGPKVEREVRKIEESGELSDQDRAVLLEFKREQKIRGLTDGRIHKLLCHLRVLAEHLEGDLHSASEEDLKDLVEWVESRDLARPTKSDYRGILKQFYKFLDNGEYPVKVRWIRTTRKRRDRKLPEKLLREDDVEALDKRISFLILLKVNFLVLKFAFIMG